MDKEVIVFREDKDIYVSISLEEYKELLITKGKYEELKSQYNAIPWTATPGKMNITYSTPR